MKTIIAACTLLCTLTAHAAGFQTLDIPYPAGKPISLAIWYPSLATTRPRSMDTFNQSVATDGAIEGDNLPIVLMSHGTGGSMYSHHDTALALAEAGFVVVAPTHTGDNYADQSRAIAILERPMQMVAALDYMLKAWPQRERVAASRVGIFGFSAGGFTALVNVGGQPDMNKVFSHCDLHPDQFVCMLIAGHAQSSKDVPMRATPEMHDRRIRAAVIAAPALGFTFDAGALKNVGIPMQLWRAEADEILPNPWYAEHVRQALPRKPDYRVVPRAGHFDFLAPCTEKLATLAPVICTSADGVDRAQFHRLFNTEVIGFFKRAL